MATESGAADDASTDRVSQVRRVRRRLVREGPPRSRPYEDDFHTITVPEGDCDALRDLLIAEQAWSVIEVGLAYGSSALAIGEALVCVGHPSPSHVAIDPLQESEFANAGWESIRAAGLDGICTLIPERSQIALPRLVADEHTADAAYVDGSHIFHAVFVDLYYLRQLVRPGGVIVVDDHHMPSVATAVRYYETNLGWKPLVDGSADPVTQPRTRGLRLPDPPFERGFRDFIPF